MTLVVCPNLAIDRVLEAEALRPGTTMRCRALNEQAGGKGANVARALRALGGAPVLAGFAAGHGGRLIADLAADEGLEVELVVSGGEARVSTVVLAADGPPTRLFEFGPRIGAAEERALLAVVEARRAAPGEWAIVDGAVPPGASDGFYGALCRALRCGDYAVMVDATGAQLAGALSERPDFVKVNAAEAASVAGDVAAADPEGRVSAGLELSRRLVRAGAAAAVVTLGAAGAAGTFGGGEWLVRTPPVTAVNTVGSGDCFAAALLLAFERGEDAEAALRAAAGAAAANAAAPITGRFDLETARDLARRASVGPPAA